MDKSKIILILILVLALLVRYIKVDQSFWLDEASQAILSSKSLSFIWFERGGDFHPPLFYVLSHFWLQVDRSEIWLRTLPIIFGMLTIYLTYVFGNHFYNRKVGFLAALFLAINPFHVYYSQEFRMYSLLCLLGLWSMYLFWKKSRWLFIANTLLLYTHYSSVYVFLTQIIFLLLFERSSWKFYFWQILITFLLFVPWLNQFIKQFQTGVGIDSYLPGWRSILTIPTIKALPTIIFKFVAGRINLFPKWIYGLYILIVMIVSAAAVILSRQRKFEMWIWLGVPILASMIVSFWVPQTQPFRLIFVLPALIFIFAEAASRFPRLFISFVLYFAIVGLVLTFTRTRLLREQWREASNFLSTQEAVTVVKFPEAFAPLQWYTPNLNVIGAVPSFPAKSMEVAKKLQPLIGNSQPVYVLEYLQDLTDPQLEVERVVQELGYRTTQGYDFPGVGKLQVFEKP